MTIARTLLLLAALVPACTARDGAGGDVCLPAARASGEPEKLALPEGELDWYCEDPPPPELLTGDFRTRLVWIEGETCDPCDRERIAARAMDQVCADLETDPPVRLLCGPVAYPLDPWDRKGCVYAVADAGACPQL